MISGSGHGKRDEEDVKMKEKGEWQADNAIKKKEKNKKETSLLNRRRRMRKIMYIYDGAEDQRVAFGTLFTFLGDLNSSEVRSRDRFVCHPARHLRSPRVFSTNNIQHSTSLLPKRC